MGSYFSIICALLLHNSLGWAVDNPSCAGIDRCFETSSQGFHVSLQSGPNNDGVKVVASGPSNDPKNYLAIGFTSTGQMANAAVFVCLPGNKVKQFAIGGQHTPPVPNTFTKASDPQVSNEGGQVKCSFTIPSAFSVDPARSFDLSKQQDSLSVLLATGTSDGNEKIEMHSPSGRTAQAVKWSQMPSQPKSQPQPPTKQPDGPSPSSESPKTPSQPTPRDSAAAAPSLIPTVGSLVFIGTVLFSTFIWS